MNDLIGLMGPTNDRPTAKTIEVCPKSIGESDLCAESNFTGELVGRSESSSKFRVKMFVFAQLMSITRIQENDKVASQA